MTVNKLIKLLEKMPPKAKIAFQLDDGWFDEWRFELIELSPYFKKQVPMHSDWHENQKGKPHHLDMVIIGAVCDGRLE